MSEELIDGLDNGKSWRSLLIPIGVIGLGLALVPLWLGDSRVMMGVAVLGLAFMCYAIGFNIIFGSTGQLFLCVGALAGLGGDYLYHRRSRFHRRW